MSSHISISSNKKGSYSIGWGESFFIEESQSLSRNIYYFLSILDWKPGKYAELR